MPYRHAHYYVGFVLLVILVGFWASYWKLIGGVPLAFHIHAMSSTTWLLLLIVQSVAIHRRANAFHKTMGLASFALFPFLILGFVMIIDISAQRYASAESPFAMHNTPAFGAGMVISISAYLALYYQALKNRRNVKLHAGYMLATPLILFESPFGRIIEQYLPWLNFIGSEGPQVVQDTIVISDLMAIAFAMVLYAKDRKHGMPWLVASGFMGLQAVVMWNAPFVPQIGRALGWYAQIPLGVTASFGVVLGALTGWMGWRAGGLSRRSAAATPA